MKKAQAVSLTVHRNTVERHRKRALAKELQGRVEALVREQDIRAYAVVGIGANGEAYALWDTGAILPMWAFPATVREVLRADMQSSGIEDDWRPTLTVKGSQ